MGGHPKYGFGNNVFHPENFKGKKNEKDWQILEECCPFNLIHVTEDSINWESEKCTNCMACLGLMIKGGIVELSDDNLKATNAAIADACLATVKTVGSGKVAFINLAVDISAACDCITFADVPILPHLGVFASYDPVAIDKACLDKALEAEGVRGSKADEMNVLDSGKHKFEACSSMWRVFARKHSLTLVKSSASVPGITNWSMLQRRTQGNLSSHQTNDRWAYAFSTCSPSFNLFLMIAMKAKAS